jgi:hypothetical protein
LEQLAGGALLNDDAAGAVSIRERRPVFSDFTNAGYWLPACKAQNKAMDKHMEKYNLQKEDWRPGMFKMMEKGQK